MDAADKMRRHWQEQRRAMEMELEQARYESRLCARRYEAVRPDNRLVAAELEGRWNVHAESTRARKQTAVFRRCREQTLNPR